MNIQSPKPDAALDAGFCDLLSGWDELEKRLGNEMFLDQNMVGWKTKRGYQDRKEVMRDLNKLRDTYPHDDSYGRQIDRLIFYVQDLITPDVATHEERVRTLIGVRFAPFPDEMVDDGRAALTKQAASLGIKFDENLQRAILQKDNEVAPENLPLLVQQVFEAGGKTFSALTGLPANARYTPKFVASEAGWNAYSSGVGDHFEIQINTRNSDNKYQSRTEGFIRHEVLGHALYHTTNLKRIQSKDLPQSAGLILLPAYDLLADEGCAEISKRIYATSPLASLSETMWDYDRLCLTNAYHTALNISPDAAEKQLRETSPYYKPENFRSHLKLLQDDQFWRYYLWGYGPARTFFRYAHEHLGENFGGFLKDCYTTPRDVVDLGKLAHAHGLTADQVNYGLRPAQPFMANSFPGSNTRPSARHIASTDGLGLT